MVNQNRFLDAAQIVCDLTPTPDLHHALRNHFHFHVNGFSNFYKRIVEIDPKIIITTNYDCLLEENLKHYNSDEAYRAITHTSRQPLNYIRSPIRCIMKFHGCISDEPNIVLSRTSYFRAKKENPGYYNTISALMTVNTMIFVGYGMSDPDIQLILENINLSSNSDNPHYVLASKMESPALRQAYEQTYNVKIIEYPTGQHGRMLDYLDNFADLVSAFRANNGIS